MNGSNSSQLVDLRMVSIEANSIDGVATITRPKIIGATMSSCAEYITYETHSCASKTRPASIRVGRLNRPSISVLPDEFGLQIKASIYFVDGNESRAINQLISGIDESLARHVQRTHEMAGAIISSVSIAHCSDATKSKQADQRNGGVYAR